MKKLSTSNRGKKIIASPIRKFLPLLQKAEASGKQVYKLNVGDPDLASPKDFFSSIKKYKEKTLGYAPSPGMKTHMLAWQKYYKQFGVSLELSQMLPTAGCAEAISFAIQAVTDYGDEIIVFEPLYVSYKSFAVMSGVKLVPVTLKIEDGFALPSIEVLQTKVSKKTKAIIVINPDNPTGKLWTKAELDVLANFALKNNLFIISDETYREIRFSGKPYCMLLNKKIRDHVILVDSVSKRFSMPGARIGCISSFNADIMASILKFAQARLSVGTLEQVGLVDLLSKSKTYVNTAILEYKKRQKVVVKSLAGIEGVNFKPANGAFYQAVQLPVLDAEDFVRFMIEEFDCKGKTVMVTPMKDFYITKGLGLDEIRIAYVLNIKDLKDAVVILKQGLISYVKNKSLSTG